MFSLKETGSTETVFPVSCQFSYLLCFPGSSRVCFLPPLSRLPAPARAWLRRYLSSLPRNLWSKVDLPLSCVGSAILTTPSWESAPFSLCWGAWGDSSPAVRICRSTLLSAIHSSSQTMFIGLSSLPRLPVCMPTSTQPSDVAKRLALELPNMVGPDKCDEPRDRIGEPHENIATSRCGKPRSTDHGFAACFGERATSAPVRTGPPRGQPARQRR